MIILRPLDLEVQRRVFAGVGEFVSFVLRHSFDAVFVPDPINGGQTGSLSGFLGVPDCVVGSRDILSAGADFVE